MTAGERVVVVGGGLAGITAALRCADAGCEVRLVEGRPRLGGATFSFRRDGYAVDNGQHVFLRCCTAYQALLDRLGVRHLVRLQPRLDVPVAMPGGHRARLFRTGMRAPLHLAPALAGYRALRPADRARAVRGALALGSVDVDDPAVDTISFGDWLARHGQPPAVVEALWDLVGVATLNAPAARASLALAATVFQLGLLTDPAAGDIGWARVPLGELHGEAARRALAAAGVTVHLATKALEIEEAGAGWRVVLAGRSGRETVAASDVIVAVPPSATEQLLPPGALDQPAGWAARLGSTPIVNVHLLYDRPVLDTEFLAGVGTPVQWVFDRTTISGLGKSFPGQYLAVSLSAADDVVDLPASAVVAQIAGALAELLPAARAARLLDSFVTRERTATFRAAPGSGALRPPAVTRLPGLFLAGAHTATGWPATMEGAVRSGDTAAAALLAMPNPWPREGSIAA